VAYIALRYFTAFILLCYYFTLDDTKFTGMMELSRGQVMVKLALEGHVRRSTRQKFANTRLHNYHVSGLGIFFVYVGHFF